ncbi:MAG: class B sortase [Clostridiales Family XIII bacterium]|jgi:sortase B|nr:class B sortase [Clostridiales Family XIII bacterium]
MNRESNGNAGRSAREGRGGRRRGRGPLTIVLIVICAGVFAVSAYMLIDYYWKGHEAEAAFEELRPPDDGDDDTGASDGTGGDSKYAKRQAHYLKLQGKNSDIVGWLRVFGTDVNYPVMQTPSDQDYYLHRDFKKNQSAFGTLYASANSDIAKPSDVTIIYGHMMKNGSMFGGLKEYTSLSYMKKHRRIRFDTLSEERLYEVFCVFTESVNTGKPSEFKYYQASDFADEAEWGEFISKAKTLQLYDTGVSAAYGDELLALSTCEYSHADGRLVVLAKRVGQGES